MFRTSSSLSKISWTGSRRFSSGVYSQSTYEGTKISGFQVKPWLEERYEISRGGPSGSPMLIKVHSSLLKAVLSRLGRRWWNAVGFGADCEGDDALQAPGVCGELAYEDDEELAAALGPFS
jgi:hypothetical protein